jgi:hypothetical protein
MRAYRYLIYRKGGNVVNQPLASGWVPVAIVRARSRAEAVRTTGGGATRAARGCPTLAAEVVAHCGDLGVWANQVVKAVPLSMASRADVRAVLEADAMRRG